MLWLAGRNNAGEPCSIARAGGNSSSSFNSSVTGATPDTAPPAAGDPPGSASASQRPDGPAGLRSFRSFTGKRQGMILPGQLLFRRKKPSTALKSSV